jgi:hypothetical protein
MPSLPTVSPTNFANVKIFFCPEGSFTLARFLTKLAHLVMKKNFKQKVQA